MASDRLITLCHRAWALPVLAEMHRADAAGMGGARLVALSYTFGASPNAIRSSLDHLIALGLAAPNPGHGHPLRPEYILTKRGARLAPACAALDDSLLLFRLRQEAMHKWALPTIHAAAVLRPARFTALGDQLRGITDRALSQTLRLLTAGGVLRREVREGFPPVPLYDLTGTGEAIAPFLEPLAAG
ncbi:MAG: helix-turn-helix transcriptional regulator [Phycisphaeraceae bacterium]|nr:helix-turn-helix transcriptional regulator [Phycisphaeraceae bacterium]MBX3407938.1 helix-turn-helix transcriptional regulator [Phycisphaeraceae bacterium]